MKTVIIRPHQVRRFLRGHPRAGEEITLHPIAGQPDIYRAVPRGFDWYGFENRHPVITVETLRDQTELVVDVIFDQNPAAPPATIELNGETFVLEHVRGFFCWCLDEQWELRVLLAGGADTDHGAIECESEGEAQMLRDLLEGAVQRWWSWRSR